MKDIMENIRQNYKEDIEKWINGEKVYLSALSLASFSNEEILDYAKRRYEIDKNNYLNSGIWNKPVFYDRSNLWSYYYWLQLWDKDINLQAYFDYDYDTNIWPREKIQQALKKYDDRYLFHFLCFLHSNLDISFDEYIINQFDLSEETINKIAKYVQERGKEPRTLEHLISTVNTSKDELGKQPDDKQMDGIEFIYKEASKIWEHTDFFSHADLPDGFQKKDDDSDNIKRK